MESVRDQISTLVHMAVGGLVTGFLFDLYRLVRGVIRPHRLITDLGDLLFWLVATLVMFLILVSDNWGQVRVYVFLGWAIGLLLYRAVLSSSFIYLTLGVAKLFGRAADGLSKVRMSVSRFFARPFRTVSRRARISRRHRGRYSQRHTSIGPRLAPGRRSGNRAGFLWSRFLMSIRKAVHRKKTKT